MRFTFLHTADLHLGSPLTGLALKEEAVAKRVAAASRDAFTALIDAALAEKVAFVVIAGDVYDGDWKDTAIGLFFARQVARLSRDGIRVFLVSGNHDADSVITRSVTLPEGVHRFETRKAETVRLEALQVALHGRSFANRATDENLALGYPAAVPGWFNIGVLHTSLDGRPGHDRYAPCSVADLAARGYQYWALGHIHAQEIVTRDPWIVFPGNIQGRSVRETGPKGAFFVDVVDGRVAGLRSVPTDRIRWGEIRVDVAGLDDEAGVMAAVEAAAQPVVQAAGERMLAMRVRLAGTTPLHLSLATDPSRLGDEITAALDRAHPDIWLEALRIETTQPAAEAHAALGALDLANLFDGLEHDADLRARLAEEVAQIGQKVPLGMTGGRPGPDAVDDLMTAARALILGRARGDG
jgi:DNA repair exonuclease SbcCD nuclease subunit